MSKSNTAPYTLPVDAVWFITGCSSGIGLSLAKQIAAHPTQRLVATARKPAALSPISDSDRVLKLALDVTSKEAIDAAVAATLAKFGRIDVMVNNAGYGLLGDTEFMTSDKERTLFETMFWGTVALSKHAIRVMREENPKNGGKIGGVVLNVTSMGGFITVPGNSFYHSAKFAIEGFTESVAQEMKPEWNIHFCIIEPGGVKTNFAGSSIVMGPMDAAAYEDGPTRNLLKAMYDPAVSGAWAEPDGIAGVMYEVVARGRRIPIRLPLGADSWTVVAAEAAGIAEEMKELKDLAFKAGDSAALEKTSAMFGGMRK